jgi:hypothetical protein
VALDSDEGKLHTPPTEWTVRAAEVRNAVQQARTTQSETIPLGSKPSKRLRTGGIVEAPGVRGKTMYESQARRTAIKASIVNVSGSRDRFGKSLSVVDREAAMFGSAITAPGRVGCKATFTSGTSSTSKFFSGIVHSAS